MVQNQLQHSITVQDLLSLESQFLKLAIVRHDPTSHMDMVLSEIPCRRLPSYEHNHHTILARGFVFY